MRRAIGLHLRLLLCIVQQLWCHSSVAMGHQLFYNLSQGYDVNDWPTVYQNKPTVVVVQMHFNTFGSLNAANMDFKIDMFLRQRWNDPRLAHSSSKDSFTLLDPDLHKKIWKPDSFFENVKEAHIHQVTMPNMLLRIYRSGDILYSLRVTLKLSCHLDLEMYPFDNQECNVRLASYANTDDVVQYRWADTVPIAMPEDIEIAQFDLTSNKTTQHTSVYETGLLLGNYSGLTASFTLRRQNGYHVLQSYVPTFMIVAISWVSFWIDPNAVPGRITLGVTTLLTLTTLATGIRQTLPPVSYVKAIDVWIGMCMVMVFGALLEFTLVNYLANKKMINSRLPGLIKIPKFFAGSPEQDEDPVPEKKDGNPIELISVQRVAGDDDTDSPTVQYYPSQNNNNRTPKAPKPKKQGEGPTYFFYALVLDRFSRLLFPVVFLIFNLAYWPIYVYMQYSLNALILHNTGGSIGPSIAGR
uniref:Glycine receptor subunit alpha-1-like isoform X1 n=2 Tax=Hirondellea gigas TaxID=1518452 RepID=A0A6A7G011_9CRUS